MPKKIVVIGPESTGKSTLCTELAQHYRTDWVPEYARDYLHVHGMGYSYENLLTIAKGQLALEDAHTAALEKRYAAALGDPRVAMLKGKEKGGEKEGQGGEQGREPILFIDTDMYVMKVWCEFVFGKCHSWILDQIAVRKYDAYLLCRTDLPWVEEELREYPDLDRREKLFHIYRDGMINQSTPWAEIGGIAEERLKSAVAAVDKLIGR